MKISTYTDPAYPVANGEGVAQATSVASEFGQRATAAIDDKRESAAQVMDSAASTLRGKAETLPGGEKVTRAAHSAADAIETGADYVRDQDVRAILSDVKQIVKRHPGATLIVAAALGFLLARNFSRN